MVGFKRGEIILKSEPFAYALNDREKGRYCDYCFKFGGESEPSPYLEPSPKIELKKCSQCHYVYFCDKTCQSKAWKLFHKMECVKMSRIQLTVTGVFVARVFFKLLTLKKFPNAVPFEIVGSAHRTFDTLVSHSQEIRNDKRKEPNLKILVEMLRQFSPEHFSEKNSSQNIEMLVEIFCKITINSFELGNWEMMPIGVGIYLGTSFFDHSCDPDAFVSFDGTTSIVRALKNIPHSNLENIKVCYIDSVETKADRKKTLKEQYYFDCECRFCAVSKHETEKLYILNEQEAVKTDILARSENLLLEAKNLNLMNTEQMQNTLEKCKSIAQEQRDILGELHIHRANVALLGFDLSVHLKVYDAAVDFGKESLKSLLFFKGQDPSVGILMFKLGKMLMLKDRLTESAEILRSAREILSDLFGPDHKLFQDLCTCLMPLEMELLMRFRAEKN